ncbi:alanine racemase [Winogradskyella sp. R77965]|uniref:alanine racemase n=1 Tax=Winogradskyella sp. R77965 TaxID=3093872 RepID=UPI0037DD8E6F
MAELIIHTEKIKQNIKYLSSYFDRHNKEWCLITKLFSGDKTFFETILTQDVIESIDSIGDSRLTSLRDLRASFPHLKTFYIKPPEGIYADDVVDYADISLNTSFSTIEALNVSAKKKNVIHKIIIMVELGDLREGVNSDDVIEFYKSVYDLSNIEVIGIGTNLGCMHTAEPTYDILNELSLKKELISDKFNKNLELLSGGTSVTLPLLENAVLPEDINHFRIGEAAFLGIIPLKNKKFKDLHTDIFEFYANIIELEEKKVASATSTHKDDNTAIASFRAILDFGLLDVDKKDIETEDSMSYIGATSDMFVIDLGDNKTKSGMTKYKVGDRIKFKPNYMAISRLLNSKFIQKRYI